jgi:hypothetical protein
MTLIIPFTSEQITWHLKNNIQPKLKKQTIEKIVTLCNLVNMQEINLDDEITEGSCVSVAAMLDDLKIEYNI